MKDYCSLDTLTFYVNSLLAEALLLEEVELMETVNHSFPDTDINILSTVVEKIENAATLCLFSGEAAALPIPSEEITDVEIKAMVVSIMVGERYSPAEEHEIAFSENVHLLPPDEKQFDIVLPKFLSNPVNCF
jgi:hypothetical protein